MDHRKTCEDGTGSGLSYGGGNSSAEPEGSAGREFNSTEGAGQAQITGF